MDVTGFAMLSEEERGNIVCLQGYIVLKYVGICLIDFNVHPEWEKTDYVKLKGSDLEYALRLKLAVMGGGNSVFFHEAQITGHWDAGEWVPSHILAKNTRDDDWFEVPIDEDALKKGKKTYGHLADADEETTAFWRIYSKNSD
ncbi:hypothetical protein ACFQ4O_05510 [Methylopila musalis]|uniref:Uncharacterized protein n=1 Tax=Methylopila musalis TaxID=1134781 RepID=A0ABW3Z5A6_9HYPH